jgi:hypothetical protein
MRRALPTTAEAQEILARTRTRPVRRQPPVAGKALSAYIRTLETRFGETGGPGVRLLAPRWREIVGEVLGRRTEPVKLVRPRRGGGASLEVRVDGAGAALIQHQAPDILARVNLILGEGAVDKLRIVQGPIKPLPAAQTATRKRNLAPLDAALEAELAKGLEKPGNAKLKAALLRLGREVARSTAAVPPVGRPGSRTPGP